MRPRRWLPLLALFSLAAFGLWAGWFRVGFSPSELAELERGWTELREWARIEESGPPDERALERIARDWEEADSESEQAEILERFKDALADPEQKAPIDWQAMLPLIELARRAIEAPDADEGLTGHVLVLARGMQRRGHLLTFFVGTSLATDVLARCRENAALIPMQIAAPPPRPAELFEALCRDHVLVSEMLGEDGDGRGLDAGVLPALGDRDGEEFVWRSLRAALVEDARRLYPLRNEPARFAELPRPESPGLFVRFRATYLGRPADMQALLSPLLTADIARLGATWSEFITDWHAVLGD